MQRWRYDVESRQDDGATTRSRDGDLSGKEAGKEQGARRWAARARSNLSGKEAGKEQGQGGGQGARSKETSVARRRAQEADMRWWSGAGPNPSVG